MKKPSNVQQTVQKRKFVTFTSFLLSLIRFEDQTEVKCDVFEAVLILDPAAIS